VARDASTEAMREAILQREQAAFASAAQSLRQALQDMPELAELSKNILIDQTPEGLRVQLVDQEGDRCSPPAAPNPTIAPSFCCARWPRS
jgi:chemotaxis protein MotB